MFFRIHFPEQVSDVSVLVVSRLHGRRVCAGAGLRSQATRQIWGDHIPDGGRGGAAHPRCGHVDPCDRHERDAGGPRRR
jgi:hypothetical protein